MRPRLRNLAVPSGMMGRVSTVPCNTFAEGDNVAVLAGLPPASYDLIYIDPPYNTGSAFAYQDRFADHREWTAMMRPRLEAGRRVLADAGAIFVSIDDHEVARLRLLLDEVYGEQNLLAQIVVNLNPKGRQLGSGFATSATSTCWPMPRTCGSACSTRPAPDLVDRARLPAGGRGRASLSAAAAAQHQQEVQPG